jgi:type I restriction enzyme S subunit
MRLRSLIKVNPPKSEVSHLPSATEATFAPMEALADGLGGLDTSVTKTIGEVGGGSYSFFAEGDVLLAKVTPCFENGKKAIARGLSNGIGFATSEVHVIRPDVRRLHRGYLRYLLCSEDFRAAGMASMTGAGGLRRVSEDAIRNFCLPIISLETQKAIADFLDRETAPIDLLVYIIAEGVFSKNLRPMKKTWEIHPSSGLSQVI